MLNAHEPIDTIHRIETPENIEITIRPAGVVLRLYAFLIDLMARIGIVFGCILLFSALDSAGIGLILIAVFLVEWLYPVLLEVLWGGRTLGKAAVGLKVVMDDGTPVGWSASLIRNLLRMADFLPGFYLTGLAVSLFSHQSKRLGDIAAGTIVIYRDTPEHKPVLPNGIAKAPRIALSLPERRSITDFAERGALFSSARREELANIVEPLTKARDVASVARLVEMARWYTGQELTEPEPTEPEQTKSEQIQQEHTKQEQPPYNASFETITTQTQAPIEPDHPVTTAKPALAHTAVNEAPHAQADNDQWRPNPDNPYRNAEPTTPTDPMQRPATPTTADPSTSRLP